MSDTESASDAEQFHPGYGHGGVPWLLMLLYIVFLVFFTWYVVEFQLPDYMQKGPVKPAAQSAATK